MSAQGKAINKNMNLSVKLPLVITAMALFTSIVIGFISDQQAIQNLEQEARAKMSMIASARKEHLKGYLKSIDQDLKFQSDNPFVIEAVKDFTAAWNELGTNQTEYLQKWYINQNPNPTGQKEKLDYADDGSTYSDVHAKYHPWMREFLYERGYYDIFLFDTKGNLVYSVYKELDYATNVNTGEWRDTDLGNSFRDAVRNPAHDHMAFFDFKPYAPSNDAPASFISKSIHDTSGEVVGVLVYQMPLDAIKEIMQNNEGLGETGEVYLVGQDKLLRNDLRLAEASTILKTKAEMPYIQDALEGNKGSAHAPGLNGQEVLSGYDYLDFHDVRWAVVGEITWEEASAPIVEMHEKLFTQGTIALLLVTIIGYFLSRGIARQVVSITDVIRKVAEGQKNIDIPFTQRGDEIGEMARSMRSISEVGAQSALLQYMVDNLSLPVMMCDKEFNITYANDISVDTLGQVEGHIPIKASEVVGSNIDIFHKNPSHQRKLLSGLSEGNQHPAKFQVGDEWLSLNASAIYDHEGNFDGAYITWQLVTEQVQNEEMVKKAQESIQQLILAAREGELDERIAAEQFSGFYKDLAVSMNGLMDTIVEPVRNAITTLNMFATGDLSSTMDGQYKGAFGEIQAALNGTIERLRSIVHQIIESSRSVNEAANEITSGSHDLSQRTETQASNLEETAASMEQITGTVRQNTENASNANKMSSQASEVAQKGGAVAKEAVEAMETIEKSSQKISDIIGVIDEIAFQTNLLALNAAVEAARAGEAGKGFAVVASEVRALAGRSSSASKEIKGLISESSQQVENGAKLVNNAGETLNEIVDSVQQVAALIADIAAASAEQSSGIDEINSAITQMDEMTQQNAALVEENTASAQSLVDQANQMDRLMGFFSVGDEEEGSNIVSMPSKTRTKEPGNGEAVIHKPENSKNAKPVETKKVVGGASASTNYDDDWQEF